MFSTRGRMIAKSRAVIPAQAGIHDSLSCKRRRSWIPACVQGCPGKGLRLRPAIWLAFNTAGPRRSIAVNPPWRLEGTRNTMSARAAPWRVLRLRSAPSGDADRSAWLLATKTFCCRSRPFGRFGQQNVLVAKRPSRRARVKTREAERSDRRSRLGLEARPPRWPRGVRDLLSRARSLLSLARQKPANKLDIALFRDGRAPGVKFALIFPGQPCAQAGIHDSLSCKRRRSWIPACAGMTSAR